MCWIEISFSSHTQHIPPRFVFQVPIGYSGIGNEDPILLVIPYGAGPLVVCAVKYGFNVAAREALWTFFQSPLGDPRKPMIRTIAPWPKMS